MEALVASMAYAVASSSDSGFTESEGARLGARVLAVLSRQLWQMRMCRMNADC